MLSRIVILGLLALAITGTDAMPRHKRQQIKAVRDSGILPNFLLDCYNRDLYNETTSFPMTMQGLIGIVKKIESTYLGQGYRASDLASALLYTFRYDGVTYQADRSASEGAILFIPQGTLKENMDLVMNFVPSLAQPNFEILTFAEKCTLHFMLSYNVNETMASPDENCDPRPRPYNYKVKSKEALDSLRVRRDTPEESETFMERVYDFIEPVLPSRFHSKRQIPPKIDPLNDSQCPRESGVVFTEWGTVAAGTVLAGIVSGTKRESVHLLSVIEKCVVGPSTPDIIGDNGWLVTLAGPAAEYAIEDKLSPGSGKVGLAGWWRDILLHKEYHLSQDLPGHFTQSELIGGIDGWLLYNNAQLWNQHGIKLSQLLDMYYSEAGVFNEDTLRACNRYNTFATQFDYGKFETEAEFFGYFIFCNSTVGKGIKVDSIGHNVRQTVNYTKLAIDKLSTNTNCSHAAGDVTDPVYEPNVDLYLVPDYTTDQTSFSYQQHVFASLAQDVDVSRWSSRIAVVANKNFVLPINKEYNGAILALFLNNLNYTAYGPSNTFDLAGNLQFMRDQLLAQKAQIDGTQKVNAPVIMFVSDGKGYSENTKPTVLKLMTDFRQSLPYVRVMFLTSDPTRYKDVAINTDDILQKNKYANARLAGQQIAEQSLAPIPTPLIFPACNIKNNRSSEPSHVFTDYVSQGHANLYKYDPDSFYTSSSLTVNFGSDNGLLRVCNSRDRSTDLSGSGCQQQTNAATPVSFSFSNPCAKHDKRNCKPLYFSVQGPTKVHTAQHTQTVQDQMRYPDQTKYTITHTGMTCSGVLSTLASPFVMVVSVLVAFRNLRF